MVDGHPRAGSNANYTTLMAWNDNDGLVALVDSGRSSTGYYHTGSLVPTWLCIVRDGNFLLAEMCGLGGRAAFLNNLSETRTDRSDAVR